VKAAKSTYEAVNAELATIESAMEADKAALDKWTSDFNKTNGRAPNKQEKKDGAGALVEKAKASSKAYMDKLTALEDAKTAYETHRAALKAAGGGKAGGGVKK
jgi:hypothetical protein